jgi:hypothetical protein
VISVVSILADGALGLFIGRLLARKTRLGAGGATVVGNLIAIILGIGILIATLFGGFVLASLIHDARMTR